jgi:anti-sigma regulatory factor (Ser/Thr protein kinase)
VTDDWPTVRLDLDSRPETLTLVRGALGGVADQLALDPELLDDLKTAVSEACNNVVMHAYDDEPGPLDVLLYARQDAIEVVIRDEGSGIDAIPAADDRLQGVGLPVIRALTQQSEFRSLPEGGTEVRMVFAGEREGKRLFRRPARATPEEQWTDDLSGDAVVSLSPVSFVGGVLGRLARALAAKARTRRPDRVQHVDRGAAARADDRSISRWDGLVAERERRLTGRWWRLVDAQRRDRGEARGGRRDAPRGDGRPPPGGSIAVGLGHAAQLPPSSPSGTSVSVSLSATPVSVSSRCTC